MNVKYTGYEQLQAVFTAAVKQAAEGKGKERHANGLPFHDQRMQRISTLLDSPDGMAFQVIKKLTEGLQFECAERREVELLGAINYLAGIVVWLRCRDNPVGEEGSTHNGDSNIDSDKEVALRLEDVPRWVQWVAVAPCGWADGHAKLPKSTSSGVWIGKPAEVHYIGNLTPVLKGLYMRKGDEFVKLRMPEAETSPMSKRKKDYKINSASMLPSVDEERVTPDWGAAPADATHFMPESNVYREVWVMQGVGGAWWFKLLAKPEASWVRFYLRQEDVYRLIARPRGD